MDHPLASWREGTAKTAILDFVGSVTAEENAEFVFPADRIARIGARPLLAAGNANGDVPMLHFAGGPSRPALRLLLAHDDAEREFDYRAGSELALERASEHAWTVVSIKNDWITVFEEGESW